jgi:hypothetical protein
MTIYSHARTRAVWLDATLLPIAAMLLASGSPSLAATEDAPTSAAKSKACAGDNGGITLPTGFCATVFADQIGHARHLVVAPNGVVYVNTWSGTYYGNDTPPPGGFHAPQPPFGAVIHVTYTPEQKRAALPTPRSRPGDQRGLSASACDDMRSLSAKQ